MRTRLALTSVLGILLFNSGGAAWAQAREPLPLCSEVNDEEAKAAEQLNTWLRSARIHLEACFPARPLKRFLRFVIRDDRVLVQLQDAEQLRERDVPWLDQADLPLARLGAQGALARFSLLLEGLLGESLLDAATAETMEATEPMSMVRPRPKHNRPRPNRVGDSGAPPVAELVAQPDAPAPSAPESGSAEVPEVRHESTSPAVEVPSPGARSLSFEVDGSWHLRAPDLSTWELGGAVRWRFVLLGAAWQPTTTWLLDGRPIAHSSVGILAGARVELFNVAHFSGGPLLAARAEWTRVMRRDVENAQPRDYWDLGASAAMYAARSFGPFGIEVRLEGLWFPTARVVEIQGGPQATINRWGARATLCFFYDFWTW